MDGEVLIALLGEQRNELPLQRRLALVAVRAVLRRLVGGDDGVFGGRGDYMILAHSIAPYNRLLAAFVAYVQCDYD